MLAFFTVLHILVAVFMIFVILLQPGKEDGMGAALGGGGGSTTSAFGGRGAVTFLSKLTAGCAIVFFCTSLGLSFVGSKSSVMAGPAAEAPAVPKNPTTPMPAGAAGPNQSAQPAASSAATATTPPSQTTSQAATSNGPTPAKTPAPAPAQNAPTK